MCTFPTSHSCPCFWHKVLSTVSSHMSCLSVCLLTDSSWLETYNVAQTKLKLILLPLPECLGSRHLLPCWLWTPFHCPWPLGREEGKEDPVLCKCAVSSDVCFV